MIKRLMLGILSVLLMSSACFAYTFPVDIRLCKLYGNTVGLTGWFTQERPYGYHRAYDFPLNLGTPINATEAGEVVIGQEYPKYDPKLRIWRSGYGNFVIINVYEKMVNIFGLEVKVLKRSHVYGHLDTINGLKTGDTVSEGQVIGFAGTSGIVDERGRFRMAVHLHYEVRDEHGYKMNPGQFLGPIVKQYFGIPDATITFTTLEGGSTNN